MNVWDIIDQFLVGLGSIMDGEEPIIVTPKRGRPKKQHTPPPLPPRLSVAAERKRQEDALYVQRYQEALRAGKVPPRG